MRSVCIVTTLVLWLAAYYWMKDAFANRSIPADAGVGPQGILNRAAGIPGGYYYALRSAWILPIMLAVTWWSGRPIRLAVFLVAVALALVPSLIVDDLSRSMAFAYPAVLIALVELEARESHDLGPWLRGAVLLNVLTPQYQVVAETFSLSWPLPVAILKAILKSHPGL